EVLDHQLVRTDRQHETPYTIRIRDRADSMTRGTHLGTRDRLCGASFDDTAVQHDALLLVVTVEGALLRTDRRRGQHEHAADRPHARHGSRPHAQLSGS